MNLKTSNTFIALFLFIFLTNFSVKAQDFMMQAWFWDYPKTAAGYNWADTLNNQAINLGQAGFTYVWLPPLSRASFGNNSNGYDPKDLYDLGISSQGPTGFGSRTDLNTLVTSYNAAGINPVVDVVYNHRDGGDPEDNASVEGWIENFSCAKVNSGDNAYPSDRYRCYLPLGGASSNGAGTYYFKIKSASKHPNYYDKAYKLYMQTNTLGYQNLPALNENEAAGNGGGDCGQGNTTIQLGIDMLATIDNVGDCSGFCGIDEFQLTINASDFNAAGDTLWIYMTNSNGNYSDHFIAGIWDGSKDIQNEIRYQTYTDFSNMPSGRGGMDQTFFKPNGSPTQLNGDWDWMWFFYDYDQSVQKTKDSLFVWSKWLWEDAGMRGFRMDAVKHFNPEFTGDLMDYLHDQNIDPGMVVGEFFDENPNVLNNWVNSVEFHMDADTKNAIKIRVFDFAMRKVLKEACDNSDANYDIRTIYDSGIVETTGANGSGVVTFVNNHDYRDAGQPVQNDPMLAYAYILTNNQIGLPCVFYPDYFASTIPNAPTVYLKAEIDALMDLHKNYIYQSNSIDYLNRFASPYTNNYISGSDKKTLLYQLSGGIAGKEVVVAINFSNTTLKLDHGLNMSNLSVGDTLYDALGNSNFPFAIISSSFANAANEIYIELPPKSYSVWINSSSAALPIELTNFQVAAQNDFVRLNWTSLEEINFSGFEIQRSLDGTRFEKIAWQEGNGKRHYQFDDQNPVFNKTLYYRLKMIDLDGTIEYSPIRSAKLEKVITDFQISPNPAFKQINLSLNSSAKKEAQIEILDAQSNLVLGKDIQLVKGFNQWEISMDSLPSGVYFLRLQLDTQSFIKKLIKN